MSTNITISNCRFQSGPVSASAILLGNSDTDTSLTTLAVTLYRNWFDSAPGWHPVCRGGMCHVCNNLYSNWTGNAVEARVGAVVLLESNVFVGGSKSKAVVSSTVTTPVGVVVSSGNTLNGGSGMGLVVTSGAQAVAPPYTLDVDFPDTAFVAFIKSNAGPHMW
eukprot:TRINITY_DN5429_c4_g1_i2.p2 TRINITY_DN5429_c4_g1~~TRINITY_DN5429_c4_g1_i2.p2  ORF type:complete len:164 (-),score=5.47 TRINITY_DN5429_c4_g1_i2:150-641(-)